MVARLPQNLDTDHLEAQLVQQETPLQRLQALEDLIEQLAFTDIHRADELLDELEEVLEAEEYPEQEFRFHLWRGSVDNQLYRYERAAIHFQIAIELAEMDATPEMQAEVYIDYAGICMNTLDFSEAIEYLDKAGQLLQNIPTPLLLLPVLLAFLAMFCLSN